MKQYIIRTGEKEFLFYYINELYALKNNIELSSLKNKNLIQIKKQLAGNEIIISFLSQISDFEYEIERKMISKRFSKIFFVEGVNIVLKKNNRRFNFIYEVIRKENDWKEKIVNKLKLYKSCYDEINLNINKFTEIPQLVLVCEDDEHVVELMKELILKKCIIDCIKLYFSTDLRIKNDVKNSIIEFKLNCNNKYEMSNKKMKL